MLSENVKESKSERLNLSALPSILRNLSQLGRSGIVRLSFRDGFTYLELVDGRIQRFLIPEDQFIDYLVHRLNLADVIKPNIAELLSASNMSLKEFSLYLAKEKICTSAQLPDLLIKFGRELLYSYMEQNNGSLDFNLRRDLISHIEPTAYILEIDKTPGQLFLDYWDFHEKQEILVSPKAQYFSNTTEIGGIFSPLEKNIIHLAHSGACLESLIEGVFEARQEVVETMLRLTKSGILIAEEPNLNLTEHEFVDKQEAVAIREASTTTPILEKREEANILERCLPVIVLALVAKFVIEFRAVIYLIENSFPN